MDNIVCGQMTFTQHHSKLNHNCQPLRVVLQHTEVLFAADHTRLELSCNTLKCFLLQITPLKVEALTVKLLDQQSFGSIVVQQHVHVQFEEPGQLVKDVQGGHTVLLDMLQYAVVPLHFFPFAC